MQQTTVSQEQVARHYDGVEEFCAAAWGRNLFVRVNDRGIALCGSADTVSDFADGLNAAPVVDDVEEETTETE